jgi:ATP adenylyltransferase
MTGSGEEPADLVAQDGISVPDRLARLWTPHRMAYIKGEALVRSYGCSEG